MKRLRIGLLVNPVAGVGGAVALKGSDGPTVQALARDRGGQPRSPDRTRRTLDRIGDLADQVSWVSWGETMGADYLIAAGLNCEVLGRSDLPTTEADTRHAAQCLVEAGIDLLVFAGGDGTARDLLESIGDRIPVLGIPAGVKMHSGVFATTPEQAGELVRRLISGGLVSSVHREVRDLDEAALRNGEIRPHFYGEMRVPEPGGYLQHTKERGRENESLAMTEIAADVAEQLQALDIPVVLGPGGTVGEIKRTLGFEGTVLGFDVWHRGEVTARDVDAAWLLDHLTQAVVVVSFTRGQGFLIGRGNQQLTPEFLRRIGRDAIRVVGTRTKLATLEGRPLLLDTDDQELDEAWTGLVEIIAGFEDRLLYRMSGGGSR